MNKKLKEIFLSVVKFVAAYLVIYLASCVASICVLPKFTPYETRYLFLIFLLTSLLVILAIPRVRNWILEKAEKEENDKVKSILLATFKLTIYIILLFFVFWPVSDLIELSDKLRLVIYYIFLAGSLAVILGVNKIRNWIFGKGKKRG